jgi:cardiolipin synthase A/B
MSILAFVLVALGASLATLILALVVANLTSSEKKIQYQIEHLYGVDDAQFARAVGSLLGPGLVDGNRVDVLSNGREIFPAMLEAINKAERTVCFETFIYWEGEVGRMMKEAVVQRARAGVKVQVLVDWLGSNKIDTRYVDEMERAGVQIERYHPVRWYNLDRVNNRTHRKLLVVDGSVGFTGGVGIADTWDGDAQDPEHWRDLHFRVRGPVVAQMQAAFMDNWVKTRARVLHGADYFPPLEHAGDSPAQMFRSSPRGGSESMRLMFLLSIACARRSIRIGNAYFVPDDLLVRALVDARGRGVSVRIIVPGVHIDTAVVRRASRSRWGGLLEAGAQVYEYQPTMYHTKLLVVDDLWASVGSTNFDNRSLRLNDEANLNVRDEEFAGRLAEEFDRDLTRSRRVTLQQWQNRPLREKAIERLAALFRSQL